MASARVITKYLCCRLFRPVNFFVFSHFFSDRKPIMRFIHTADIHLGKTYRNSPGEKERFRDFFRCLDGIVADALRERVDFVLIAGDLFHTGQILPKTFALTIETLQPLKDAGIPCIAVEGNHDWIHRRDHISWMEALSQMGYIRLLRPGRTEDGGYRFEPFDPESGLGGMLEIGGLHIYGLGYIGAQKQPAALSRRHLAIFPGGDRQHEAGGGPPPGRGV
jgi:predicted MPP superfamily phosphohydrolase